MLAIICQHVYLQVVRVRGVCARLLILFAFAPLSVYASLAAVGILHIRAVSHRGVTYGAFSWRNQFVLSRGQGQLQQARQVHAHHGKRRRLLTRFDQHAS